MSNLSEKTTIVVGARGGLGHEIATAFAAAEARLVAVSRTAAAFAERANGSATIQLEVADARDATVAAASLLDRYEPDVITLAAGALPYMRPLQLQLSSMLLQLVPFVGALAFDASSSAQMRPPSESTPQREVEAAVLLGPKTEPSMSSRSLAREAPR